MKYKQTIIKILAIVMLAGLGSYVYYQARAATPFVAIEPESGTVSGSVGVVTDTSASSTKAIQLGNNGQALNGVGFNWPEAGRVYVAHWNQQTVLANDSARAFRVAKADNIHIVRVFLGDDVIIPLWKADPVAVMGDVQRMFDDAQTNGVRLIVSNYLTKETMEKLAGKTYATWDDARREMVTPGSASYSTLDAWDKAVIGRFGNHPAAYSWEVSNEPNWMLGIDSGVVNRTVGYQFLDHFNQQFHTFGAKLVNGGGGPLYDPSLLSDTELKLYGNHLDILDNHFYPATDSANVAFGTSANAQSEIDKTNAYYQRARSVLNRPNMPAMLGEFGSTPAAWFETTAQQSMTHGWQTNVWGFDAYDQHNFTDTLRPEVLNYMKQLK